MIKNMLCFDCGKKFSSPYSVTVCPECEKLAFLAFESYKNKQNKERKHLMNWKLLTQMWDFFKMILSNAGAIHAILDELEAFIDSSTIDEALGLQPWLKNLIDTLQGILDKLSRTHAAIEKKKLQ